MLRGCWDAWLLGAVVVAGPGHAAEVTRVERGSLVLEGIPEIPERITHRLARYRNTRSASLQGWHPEGEGVLISTRFAETEQIHWVREPGGARRQLTFFDEPVTEALPSPSREVNGFLLRKDVGGSEVYQYYFFDLASGEYRLLTDGRSRNLGAVWARDGRRYAFTTTARNGKDYDVHLADVGRPGHSVPLVEESGTWGAVDASPDGGTLLVGRYVSATESHLYLVTLEDHGLAPFDPAEEPVAYGDARFAGDGKGIYLTSDRGSEFRRLQYHDLSTGAVRVLTAGIPWDVEAFELCRDGRYLAYVVNEDGISRLRLRDLTSGEEPAPPVLPVGRIDHLEFSPDCRQLGMTLTTPQTPGDVYSIDLERLQLARWTYSEVGGLRTESFAVPELVRYPTFDEVDGAPRTIPAFYYRPRGPGPFPVVIDIHGGPEAQARPEFDADVQYLVQELGVAVLAPNVRGSSGYGKSYLKLDDGLRREDSVRDLGKLLDWIAGRPELDARRMAVMGGSYGGYMVLASMVQFGDRLRAGVEVVGISNFVTFLENTQPYRRDLRRAEYGDERVPEVRAFLQRISPLTRADRIRRPMFIAQGLNDPRVPASEAEQIVHAIRASGGEAWYLLARDEGHGFQKKSNRDVYTAAVALFLERHLLPAP
jgi:dipeptidyl aminopeptidase/acylaminoacyl peptidase